MIGQTISHYRIVDKLGEGGMGVVYKAEDLRLGRTVALKFLASHLLQNEDARKRFVREAKAAAALDHPNICTLYEIDETETGAFMAMAFLEGQMLDTRVAAGPLPLPLAVNIARQVAKGLQEAHGKSISHRDIKPSNICLLQTGSNDLLAKILDFGLARAAGQTVLTRLDSTVGTIAYMSPEQTQGSGVDHRTDIWALGVVLYEMISGQRPFRGDYEKAIIYSITCEEPEPITGLRSGVPMQLEWIIGKALAKNPAQRYQSCVEILVDLDAVERTLATGASQPAATGWRLATRMTASATAGDSDPSSRKKRIRQTVLGLGSEGLLPDRILSQSLEIISRPDGDQTEELRSRNHLLDELSGERLLVGEFIERWHDLDSRETAVEYEAAPARKQKSKDERSKIEVFGLPLYHKTQGKHPATGKERVAKGIFAVGGISIGAVAIARFLAIGGIAIAPVSIGLWTLGLLAIGLQAYGLLRLSLIEYPWWQGLLIVLAAALIGGFLNSRRKSRLPGVLDGLAMLSFRTWNHSDAPLRGGSVAAICGSYTVDLMTTALADGPIEIEANAFLGIIRILAPPDRPVTVHGVPILGGFSGPAAQRVKSGASIAVRGAAVLGSVQVLHPGK